MAQKNSVGAITAELRMELGNFTSETRRGTQELKSQIAEQKRVLGELAKESQRTHQSVSDSFGKMAKSANTLQTALVALGGGFAGLRGAESFVKLADQFTAINSRLRTMTASQTELNRLYDQLAGIANKTGASLEDTAKSFQDLVAMKRDLGATNQEFVRMTEIVQKIGRIGNASTAQMSNGMLGVTQALASGKVQADEFRQINDNLPLLAQQIAKTMGVSRGELRNMIKDGQVTSKQLYDLIMASGKEVDETFQKVTKTVAASLTEIQNNLIATVGRLDESTGATRALSEQFMSLASEIKKAGNEMIAFNENALKSKSGNNIKISDFVGASWRAGVGAMSEIDWKTPTNNLFKYEQRKGGKAGGDLFFTLGETIERAQKRMDTEMSALDKKKVEQYGPFTNKDQLEEEKARVAALNKKPGPSDEFLKKLEKEEKAVAAIVAKRKEEAIELAQKSAGMDALAVQYDREVREIKATVLSTKQKQAALDSLAVSYKKIREEQGFEKIRKEQKEQIKDADELRKKVNEKLSSLKEEIKGQSNLNDALKVEAEYRALIAKGNKGSATAQGKFDALGEQVQQLKSDAIGKDAAEVYQKLADKSKDYGESLNDITTGLREQREELERQLRGEEGSAEFARARRQLEKDVNETLKEQRDALAQIDALLAKDAGNVQALAEKQKIEEEINNTYAKRVQTLETISDEEKRTKELNVAIENQKNLLEQITGSSSNYSSKVKELSQAFEDGKITAEQYSDALKKIKENKDKASDSAKGFASSITGGLSSILSGQRSVSEGFKQMAIDLGNFAAKRFLLAPLEKALSKMFDGFASGLFGGSGLSNIAGGIAGSALKGAAGSLAQAAGAGVAGGAGPSGAIAAGVQQGLQNALNGSLPAAGAVGITKPVMSLPMMAADGDVQKVNFDKSRFELPVFLASRLPDSIFRKAGFATSTFENSRHKEDDFYESTFFNTYFRWVEAERGMFRTSWFDTSSFKKPILDGATFKNAVLEGGAGGKGGGFGSFVAGRAGNLIDGVGMGILMRALMGALPGFASGGAYKASMGPAIIGENGPEIFMPNQNGFILPNWIYELLGMFGGGGLGANDLMNGPNQFNAHLFGNKFAGGVSIDAFSRSPFGGGYGGGGGSFMGSDGQMYNEYTAHLSPGGGLGAPGYGPGRAPVSAFTHGLGGQSEGNMISNKDHAYVMMNLMKRQYEENYAKNQQGNGMGGPQLQSIYDQWKRYENEWMNGGRSASMFTLSSFNPQWEMYNETARLDLNRTIDVNEFLPSNLLGMNPGTRWGGFQATPIGTSFGDGVGGGDSWGTALPMPDLPPGMRMSSYTRGGEQQLITNGPGGTITEWSMDKWGNLTQGGTSGRESAFSRGFADFKNSIDTRRSMWSGIGETFKGLGEGFGITRWGPDRINGKEVFGPYRGAYGKQSLGGRFWSALGEDFSNGGQFGRERMGPWMPGTQSLRAQVPQYDMRDPYNMGRGSFPDPYDKGYPRGYQPETNSTVLRGGIALPEGSPGKFSPYDLDNYINSMHMTKEDFSTFMEMSKSRIAQGGRSFEKFTDEINVMYRKMVSEANRGWPESEGRQRMMFEAMTPQTFRNALENFYIPMMMASGNPFFSPLQGIYGTTVRRFARGGRFKKDEPMLTGDGGLEMIIPDTAGSVVPNNRMKELFQQNLRVEVINQTGVNATTTQEVGPDGLVRLYMRAMENAAADPGHSFHRTIKKILKG